MKKALIFFTCSLLFLFGCSNEEIVTSEELQSNDTKKEFLSNKEFLSKINSNDKGIIHQVIAGGNDICEALGGEPGCDKNYSLVAIMHADGTVEGQLIDMWPDEYGGIHVEITCMIVEGNMAKVGGIVKKGRWGEIDITGRSLVVFLKDNGTSNIDTSDQIAFLPINRLYNLCDFIEEMPFDPRNYYDLTKGQISIR